ncbi:MAG TPA: hypothetical protein VKP67_03640 [Xanthobacteraceae bacterium]|nr:hypothetical protein [Xanthobacteraceae bacterium]
MHRRAEAARAVARGAGRGPAAAARFDAASAAPAGWRSRIGRALWRYVGRRLVGPVLQVAQSRWMRWCGIGVAALTAMFILVACGLWVLLASGPISFDIATPWLAAAVMENFGNRFHVDIGGTVLERDEHGHTAMRIRSVTVRDHDGTVVASAPKAEIGFSTASLLNGRPRAQRLNLVGAELAIRVETDGNITVSTGAEQRPLATAPGPGATASLPPAAASTPNHDSGAESSHSLQESFAAFLAWIDSLGALGLDGGDLTELGLKSGNLVVDDRRNGQQSRFENIHLSLTRPRAGALEFQLGSEDATRPWLLVASLKPGSDGARLVDLEARKLLLKDVLLALRVDGGQIDTDAHISAMLRAELAQDGTPQFASGRILVGPGSFIDVGDRNAMITIDRAEMQLDWNATKRALALPFQIVSGATRMTLMAQAEAPGEPNGSWALNLSGGSIVLAPTSAREEPLVLNRILVRSRIDPVARRLNIDQAEVAGKGVGVAISGNLDYSSSDPRLNIGVAARKLSLAAFKQMWPALITPAVRNWLIERASGGLIEQGEIATNAPLSTLRSGGPPVPDDGLSIQIQTSGATVRPFDNLPEIRDADLVTRIRGRAATVTLGRGVVDMPSGRKLTVANGVFEVPDTSIKNPPAKVRARVEGPVPAAAELLSMDRLKDAAGVPIDPATSHGNVLATVNLALPLNTEVKSSTLTYAIAADIVNFSADRFLMSQKVEAQTLRATANNQGYQVKGDMRIGGTPASVELRRGAGEPDGEVRMTATLDDAARTRFGLDANGAIVGPIPIKVGGRVAFGDSDSRLSIEADFTQAKFDNLFFGWTKAQNRPARATFTYVAHGKPVRLDDVAFDGSGASIRGNIEFDQNGDFAVGTFPVFGLADGDKANLRVERTPDNLYKVTIRGDTFDGRNFVKASMSGGTEAKQRRPTTDVDIDVDAKVGAVAGFKGEVLRNLDLHLLRRGGAIRNLGVTARFAGEGALQGELRGRPGERQIVYLESTDAGALFRFTDTYSRMIGGQMWIAMDPPTHDGAKQDGLMDVREFAVRGETALDGVVAGAPNGTNSGVQFSRMRVEFTRTPGKMSIHEGLVTGPILGATIDGIMDYSGNALHLRGTFVPLYGLNSAFGNIPVLGFLLGGKEGLIGSMTYEVVGPPGAPVLRVNPISAVAPGFVRKFLEFPSSLPNDRFPSSLTSRDR